jgi:hypothetical protein
MSLFVAPIIRDLNAPTAVYLGCGQQIVKKETPLSNFMQIRAMILEL